MAPPTFAVLAPNPRRARLGLTSLCWAPGNTQSRKKLLAVSKAPAPTGYLPPFFHTMSLPHQSTVVTWSPVSCSHLWSQMSECSRQSSHWLQVPTLMPEAVHRAGSIWWEIISYRGGTWSCRTIIQYLGDRGRRSL